MDYKYRYQINHMYPELPNIPLHDLDIDFLKFRHEIVTFYLKNKPANDTRIALKHYAGQTGDHSDGRHIGLNSDYSDVMFNTEYINQTLQILSESVTEADYKFFNEKFAQQAEYAVEVIGKIEKHTGIEFGRIRLFEMKPPRRVTPPHVDFGPVRYHLPIVTSPDCLFLVNGQLGTMPHYDRLYKLECGQEHSAFDLGFKSRLHLFFVPVTATNQKDIAQHVAKSLSRATHALHSADAVDLLLNASYYDRLQNAINQVSAQIGAPGRI